MSAQMDPQVVSLCNGAASTSKDPKTKEGENLSIFFETKIFVNYDSSRKGNSRGIA